MPRTRQPFADFFTIQPPIACGQVQRLEQGALRQRIQLACVPVLTERVRVKSLRDGLGGLQCKFKAALAL